MFPKTKNQFGSIATKRAMGTFPVNFRPIIIARTQSQSPPSISADDITVRNQREDASFLEEGDSRASCSSSQGRNEFHAIAAFPPPHRYVRKGGNRIKFGDESLLHLSPLYLKFLASYRREIWRELCEPNDSRLHRGLVRGTELPKIG
jgi:hypothetical protein